MFNFSDTPLGVFVGEISHHGHGQLMETGILTFLKDFVQQYDLGWTTGSYGVAYGECGSISEVSCGGNFKLD